MTSPIVVREATDADVEPVAALMRRLWAAAGPGAPGYTGASDAVIAELTRPDAILERLGGPERRLFLAGDGVQWHGFAATKRIDAGTCELAGILVDAAAAGRGIGTALVALAMERAGADGALRMIVSTEVDNAAAIAFYQARGFAITGERVEDVDGLSVPVVELERSL